MLDIDMTNVNPKQKLFFEAKAPHIAYGGARAGGKSWAMRVKFVLLAMRYPNLKILLLRRTLTELKGNHLDALLDLLSPAINKGHIQYSVTNHEFKFWNGSFIRLGYCEAEKDVYRYQGHEYDIIGLEEATQFTETQMQFLTTCNRSTRADFAPRMYYTCNPGGVGHNWVKRLFIDKEYRQYEKPEDYIFIPANIYDNKILLETRPEYLTALQNLPDDLRRAHLEGDWDALMGQFFREFRRGRHVCEPFEIPGYWRRFRAIDWGYNDPCCVLWFAISHDKRIYVYDEIYQNQTLANDMAPLIKYKTSDDKVSYTVASPDMWAKRGTLLKTEGGQTGESISDVFQKSGVHLRPADNSRVVGWQRVREYLRDAPDGKPYLQIFSNCENLIREFPLLQFDENNKEDAMDGNDHALEALRYGLMSRPLPNKEQEAREKGLLSFNPYHISERKASGFLSL